MYFGVLLLHSLLRWASIALGVLAAVSALRGPSARRGVVPFAVALDLQMLLGLALYLFLSPLVGPGSGAALGYWTLWHPALGLLAMALAHAGNLALKRAPGPRSPAGAALVALGLLAALAAVPWARPLLRT